jgi:hypothetical protein
VLQGSVVVSSVICCKIRNLATTDLVLLQDIEQVVCNIGASMTSKGVAHGKDDIVELVVVPKVVNNDPK